MLSRPSRRRHLVAVDPVEERARRRRAIRVLIRKRSAFVFSVPAFARDHAGMTPDAGVEVDHKAKLDPGRRRKGCH